MTTITIDRDVFAQHIHSLIEVMRMPNTEHVADAHNKAVRFLRAALAAQQPAPAWHDAPTCPVCKASEVDAITPRTVYACGSSDYDQRPGTFTQGVECLCPIPEDTK